MRARSGTVRRRFAAARVARAAHAAVAVLALVAVAALSGCTSTAVSAGPRFVTPPLIRYTSVLWPVPLQLVGAEPGSRVRLEARMSTARGVWSSTATYTVPASGALDLAAAKPQLSRFSEPDSAGLFWSLRGPQLGQQALAQQWMREVSPVTVTAFDGSRAIASRTFRLQGIGADVRTRTVFTRDLLAATAARSGGTAPRIPTQTHEDVQVGTFYSARSIERPRTPAVVVFDDPAPGASGDFVAPLLSLFGASVFVVPMSRSADGVRLSSIVDADTIGGVLDWLDERPDVDARQVFAYGTSQSEQLALWSAARFPDRLTGVFAAGGATALLCLPSSPVGPVFDGGVPEGCMIDPLLVNDAATPPLSVLRGSIVIGCSVHDETLPTACDWLDAAMATRGTRAGDVILRDSAATHDTMVPPGLPIAVQDGQRGEATEHARIAFWDAVLNVLLRSGRA
ncbi:acyl-CoA thioesterase/BAAT N-terminal domain-containing protein [Leifsonia sp. NPDC102414]|uniref:acyl-CoA thioesterase/BAAT N-terminal domain-containing protein n=1 Tax=Leifsonia sp. NPDC102414 TaxID=3364124 RepID=UPI00381A172B